MQGVDKSYRPSLEAIKPGIKEPLRDLNALPFEKILEDHIHYGSENFFKCVNGGALPGVFVIDRLMSMSECGSAVAAIDQSTSLTFWNSAGRENHSARLFRNADTIEVQSVSFANKLWSRISTIFPVPNISITDESDPNWERELVGTWTATSLNSDMLFARYPCGGYFAPHTDGRAVHDFNRRSFYSVIIFLNSIPDGCGGGTKFFEQKSTESLSLSACQNYWVADPSMLLDEISPVAGRMLIFHQSLVHEGVAPTSGHCKYIIRSDIIFERIPPICCQPADIEAYKIYRDGEFAAEEGKVNESVRLFRQALKMSPELARIMGQG